MLADAPDSITVPMDTPYNGNALDNANVPAGAMLTVTGFTVSGSSRVITPGSAPVTLNSPVTGRPMGTISIQATGTYAFMPAAGYFGPAPAITLNLFSTDGQTAMSSLTLDVLKGAYGFYGISLYQVH